MKAVCLQENLAKALTSVGRSVASRPQLPVLGNILLATDQGRLRLSATNLETGVHQWIGAKVETEGSFTVPARVLSEFVSSLPKGKVELSLSEQQLLVQCGSFEATFNGIASSEFPPLPLFPEKALFSFDPLSFSSAISRVYFEEATDEGRPVLTGVLLRFVGKELSFVATDGYRLSLVRIKNPLEKKEKEGKGGEEGEKRMILPARTFLEISRLVGENLGEKPGRPSYAKASEGKEDLLFALLPSGNQVIFSFESTQVISQLIGGDFPSYEKIIPSSLSTKIVVSCEELLKAVRMAAIFARESANIVRFKVEKDSLTLSANTPQVGANKSVLEVKGEGEGGEIAFNSRYLLEFLNVVGVSEISFEMSGPLSPGVFRPVGENSFLHIIMPVRVQT